MVFRKSVRIFLRSIFKPVSSPTKKTGKPRPNIAPDPGDVLVSFDVTCPFTMVPIEESTATTQYLLSPDNESVNIVDLNRKYLTSTNVHF